MCGVRAGMAVQIGLVAALLTASVATLWGAGAAAVERDRRREAAAGRLLAAEESLVLRGGQGLVLVPEWPETLAASDWDALDGWLATEAGRAFAPYADVEGGYYVASSGRYLGFARPGQFTGPPTARSDVRPSDPPARERPIIEAQLLASLEQEKPLQILVESPNRTLALRTAPLWVNGRKVAATWTLARLDEVRATDHSIRGYRTSAGFALGALAASIALSLNLVRTIGRQRTERGLLQKELRRKERLAALGKLLAGVAHEVRNPLAGIRSTAQLWQRGFGPDSESIDDLVAEVDRLEAIVGQLLQFSKSEAVALAPGVLNDVVGEAARLARGPAEAHGVRLELDLDPALAPVALSGPALLQVLRNLSANAIQAMPGGGALSFQTRNGPGRRSVELAVRDTGIGLAPEALEHLFEPFFTTKPEGTGLGLAIAREIALAHHAELRAANRADGPGAVFTLVFPAAESVGRGP